MNYPHDLYLRYSTPIILSERRIPFCGNKGFPTLCPCNVTHLEFYYQNNVWNIDSYRASYESFKINLFVIRFPEKVSTESSLLI